MHAEVEAREAHRDRGRVEQRQAAAARPNARAAAKLDVACEEGKERPVGVAIRCGRSSTAGRCRPTASLIEVETMYAAPTHAGRARPAPRRRPGRAPSRPRRSRATPRRARRAASSARTQRTAVGRARDAADAPVEREVERVGADAEAAHRGARSRRGARRTRRAGRRPARGRARRRRRSPRPRASRSSPPSRAPCAARSGAPR